MLLLYPPSPKPLRNGHVVVQMRTSWALGGAKITSHVNFPLVRARAQLCYVVPLVPLDSFFVCSPFFVCIFWPNTCTQHPVTAYTW